MKKTTASVLLLLTLMFGVAVVTATEASASIAACVPGQWGSQKGYASLIQPGGYHGTFEAEVTCFGWLYSSPTPPSGSRYIGIGTLYVSRVCVIQTIGGYPAYALACQSGTIWAQAAWRPGIWVQARVYLTNGTSYGSQPVYTG